MMFLEELMYPAFPFPIKSSLTATPWPGWRVRMVLMVVVLEKSTEETATPEMFLAEED